MSFVVFLARLIDLFFIFSEVLRNFGSGRPGVETASLCSEATNSPGGHCVGVSIVNGFSIGFHFFIHPLGSDLAFINQVATFQIVSGFQ